MHISRGTYRCKSWEKSLIYSLSFSSPCLLLPLQSSFVYPVRGTPLFSHKYNCMVWGSDVGPSVSRQNLATKQFLVHFLVKFCLFVFGDIFTKWEKTTYVNNARLWLVTFVSVIISSLFWFVNATDAASVQIVFFFILNLKSNIGPIFKISNQFE